MLTERGKIRDMSHCNGWTGFRASYPEGFQLNHHTVWQYTNAATIHRSLFLRQRSFTWLWLVPVFWLVTWLGARGLGADAYWLDETWSLYSSGAAQYGPLSPAEIWTRTATEDFGGPGYHFVLGGWGALVGWTPFAARGSSLLFGLLAMAWLYRLGREMVSPLAGVSAAVLFGGSAFTIYFLHELRTYMLSVMLVAFTLWAYWRLAYGSRKPGFFLQAEFVVGVAGLLYTHYYIALILPVISLYHLLAAPKQSSPPASSPSIGEGVQTTRNNPLSITWGGEKGVGITRRWWRVVALMGIGGLLFLPWVSVVLAALRQFNTGESAANEPGLSVTQLLERTAAFFSSGAVWLLVIVGLLAVYAVGVYRRQSIAAWLWALLALAVLVVVNERTALIKPGRERYLLMVWPPLALMGGIGLASLSRTRLRFAIIPLLSLWLFFGTQATLDGGLLRDSDGAQTLPFDQLAEMLKAQAQPGDAVAVHLTTYNWVLDLRPMEYYLYGLPVRFMALESLPNENFLQAARDFVDAAANVWVGVDKRLPTTPRLSDFTSALAEEYAPCGTVFDRPRLRLDRYRRFPPTAFDLAQSAILRFDEDITLTYADVTQEDGRLTALLLWSVGADVPPYTYSVGLHLMDSAGNLAAQADYGLPLETFACRETVFDDVPPGKYQLLVTVYNWSNGERLPGENAKTGESGDRLPLAVFSSDG